MGQGERRFPISGGTVVCTTSYVMRNGSPILMVSHDADGEGRTGWQFHAGNDDYEPEVLMLVTLDEVLRLDPSITEVADLAPNWEARRRTKGGPWVRKPSDP